MHLFWLNPDVSLTVKHYTIQRHLGARNNQSAITNQPTRHNFLSRLSTIHDRTQEHTEVIAPILEAISVSEGVATFAVAVRAILPLQHTPVN